MKNQDNNWLEEYLLTGEFPKEETELTKLDRQREDERLKKLAEENENEDNADSNTLIKSKPNKRKRQICLIIGLFLLVIIWVSIFYFEIKHKDVKIPYDTSFELQTHLFEKKYPQYESDGKTLTTTALAELLLPTVVEIEIYDNKNQKRIGSGSGIIMNSDGYILTNSHVIENDENEVDDGYDVAENIYVKLYGEHDSEKGVKAEYVGKDRANDIGVIKVSGLKNLNYAVFGDSDNLKTGEKIIVIGNPQNLGLSISEGIISALDRKLSNENGYIQTTAAINPGNSGGAIVDMYGTVVGIVSAKYNSSEALGFAIPINLAKPIVEDIIKYGYVRGHYRIGITVGDASESSVKERYKQDSGFDIPENLNGLVVFNINKKFNISSSGIKEYDIVLQINGNDIVTMEDMKTFTSSTDDKTPFSVTVYRYEDNEWKTVTIDNVYLTEDKSGDY